MKPQNIIILIALVMIIAMNSCNSGSEQPGNTPAAQSATAGGGQSNVADNESQKDIVKVAMGSADHTTLVTALKAAEYVDVLANAGPFTVFAPTNDAFAKLPAGTVENLLKPENKDKLRDILEYHVFVAALNPEQLTDGRVLNMVNLQNTTIKKEGENIIINNARVLGSVQASNGIIYVVDQVLLPPSNN